MDVSVYDVCVSVCVSHWSTAVLSILVFFFHTCFSPLNKWNIISYFGTYICTISTAGYARKFLMIRIYSYMFNFF